MQLVPLQHPVGQLEALQPTHAWAVHWAAPQLAQACPPEPQALALVPAWHWLLPQQPLGQEVPLHWQAPLTHCWPTAQRLPLAPQLHTPLRQRSARIVSQAAQVPPSPPQLVALWLPGSTQALPAQQPPSAPQLALLQLHTPLTHCCPGPQGALLPQLHMPPVQALAFAPQVAQALPPVPHALALVAVTQVPALQQPLGQLVASQTQTPLLHR
jgi:hypothetical protein